MFLVVECGKRDTDPELGLLTYRKHGASRVDWLTSTGEVLAVIPTAFPGRQKGNPPLQATITYRDGDTQEFVIDTTDENTTNVGKDSLIRMAREFGGQRVEFEDGDSWER